MASGGQGPSGNRPNQQDKKGASPWGTFGLGIVAGAAAAGAAYLASELYDEYQEEKEAEKRGQAAASSGRTEKAPTKGTPAENFDKLKPAELKARLESEQHKRLCVICLSNLRCIMLKPCRHMCLCPDCKDQLMSLDTKRKVCPICRTPIRDVEGVYVA